MIFYSWHFEYKEQKCCNVQVCNTRKQGHKSLLTYIICICLCLPHKPTSAWVT